MFSNVPQKIDVDGQLLPIASIIRRGAAISVDLCMAVAVGAFGFYIISLFTPLDTPPAKVPIGLVMCVVVLFMAIGRNRFQSPGRLIFRLKLTRLPGQVPGLYGRSITVHVDPEPTDEGKKTTTACLVVTLCTLLAIYTLSAALHTTTVFQTVVKHVERQQPFAAERGTRPILSSVPRALLIAPQRAYVQIGATWGEHRGVLEYFLVREGREWAIELVRETEPTMIGNYSLSISPSEIPALPAQ